MLTKVSNRVSNKLVKVLKKIVAEHPEFSVDFPYVHYSKKKFKPTIPTTLNYTDPAGIYFFTKKKPPRFCVWQYSGEADYAHEANIDTTNVLDFSKLTKKDTENLLEKAGIDFNNFTQLERICRHYTSSGILGSTILKDWPNVLKNQKDFLAKFSSCWSTHYSFLWYSILVGFFADAFDFANFLKNLGYTCLFDKKGIIHQHEETNVIVVLDPSIITWGSVIKYNAEKDFKKIHSNKVSDAFSKVY